MLPVVLPHWQRPGDTQLSPVPHATPQAPQLDPVTRLDSHPAAAEQSPKPEVQDTSVHEPPLQAPVAFGSAQAPITGVRGQLPALQASEVQTFPSTQLTGTPAHLPALQASPVVHASPSVQGVPVAAFVLPHRPVVGLHESRVHGFPSSQTSGAPTQSARVLH